MKRNLISLILFLVIGCQPTQTVPKIDEAYLSAFEAYQTDLEKERDYYLKLCGLHKLPPLTSALGSDSLVEIRIDVPGLPDKIGIFSYVSEEITFVAEENVSVVNKDGETIQSVLLDLDDDGNSQRMYLDRLSWRVITRGGEPYVRVWDEENPAVEAFDPFDKFELTEAFIFLADFRYYDEPKSAKVATQLGPMEETKFIGQLTFTYQNKHYTLDVGTGGFTMVGDATTGQSTYGGGRYIDLPLPEKSGSLVLDFNYLYNPPCTFSNYTTCQYPPKQNTLPFTLNAGERYNGH